MGSNSLRIERRGRVTLLTTDRPDVAFPGRSSLCSPVSILAKKEGGVPNRLAKSRASGQLAATSSVFMKLSAMA